MSAPIAYQPDSLWDHAYTYTEKGARQIKNDFYHKIIQKHQCELDDDLRMRNAILSTTIFFFGTATLFFTLFALRIDGYAGILAGTMSLGLILGSYLSYRMIREVKETAKELEKDRSDPFNTRIHELPEYKAYQKAHQLWQKHLPQD